jgi:microcystin-dependent protein
MTEIVTVPPASIADLAAEIKAARALSAKMRVAVVTAVESAVGRRVQTDQTGTGWIARSEDTYFAVGDRVWLLQQESTFLVGGRLSGEPGGIPIGAIMPFAGTTAPPGWLACNGSQISRLTYAQLYAVVGNGYGAGDGSSTFNLPNLEGRFPLGSLSGTYAATSTGGAATVALTTGQLPAHTHGSTGDHTHTVAGRATAGTATGGQNVSATTAGANLTSSTDGAHTHTSVGSGLAHENLPPYLTILYIVRAL